MLVRLLPNYYIWWNALFSYDHVNKDSIVLTDESHVFLISILFACDADVKFLAALLAATTKINWC